MTTLTMSEIIDEALELLYRTQERPLQVVIGANDLSDASDTTLTLADASAVQVTSVVEFGPELVLVTGKTADVIPVLTVSRGYLGTTASAHPTGTVGELSPTWTRQNMKRSIERYFSRTANVWLPSITSGVFNVEVSGGVNQQYVEMPITTIRVAEVRHMVTLTGRIVDLPGWQFEQNLPTSVVSTGKALRVDSSIVVEDDLIVTYQVPYTWSTSPVTEASTIDVPLGSEDLPVLFAAARAVTHRDISRVELDHSEEWTQNFPDRRAADLRLAKQLWQEFYAGLDEARRIHYVPRHRPFRKMARLS